MVFSCDEEGGVAEASIARDYTIGHDEVDRMSLLISYSCVLYSHVQLWRHLFLNSVSVDRGATIMTQKCALLAWLVFLLLTACNTEEPKRGCNWPAKEDFSESDLIGIWGGDIEHAWDSLIVIRGDGRYKQIININRTGFQYESDWRPWRVTYSEKGLPYLHLEGMLMCAYWWQVDCRTGQSGLEPFTPGNTKDPFGDATYWYDGCQNKWINTPGEGVYYVIGDEKLPPRGIMLVPLTKSPDGADGPWYELHEPNVPTVTPDP